MSIELTDAELVTIGDCWAQPSSLSDLVDAVEFIVAARVAEALRVLTTDAYSESVQLDDMGGDPIEFVQTDAIRALADEFDPAPGNDDGEGR